MKLNAVYVFLNSRALLSYKSCRDNLILSTFRIFPPELLINVKFF